METLLSRLATAIGALAIAAALPSTARADFFDGMRQTFQSDIPHFFQKDVPHFFQDDVPCAFGGRPTSGTKKSCSSSDRPAASSGTDVIRDPAKGKSDGGGRGEPKASMSGQSKSPGAQKAAAESLPMPKSANEAAGDPAPGTDTTNAVQKGTKGASGKTDGEGGAAADAPR